MRILIVEDNPTTAAYLDKGLREHHFIPEIASDGETGLHLALNQTYDAIVLDVMLPKMEGWTVIQNIRRSNQQIPIIFLTARDTVSDRVKGLGWGADDYLVKPFAFSELLARLRSLLRRKAPISSRILSIDDLLIDQDQFRAMRDSRVLTLSPKEFMLLCLFANKRGQVLTRTYIAEQVWDIQFDSNTNAQVNAARGKQGTLGLGLPIVKSIADLHHATINLRSKRHHGTTVSMVFPI